jgi:hypothetical protein
MDFREAAEGSVSEDLRDAWESFMQALPHGADVEVVHGGSVDAMCSAALASTGLQDLGFVVLLLRRVEEAADVTFFAGGQVFRLAEASLAGAPQAVAAWNLWTLFDERRDMQALAWLAAVPLLERHGLRASSPFLKMAKAGHTLKALRTLLTWCVLAPHAESELRDELVAALCSHRDPRALARSKHASVVRLRDAEAAIAAAQVVAGSTTPHLAGHLALIRMCSACQIQSLVAAEWSRRLPGYVVMVANEAADRVRLATCSASRLKLDDFFRSLALPTDFVADGEVARSTWEQVLRKCGHGVFSA